MRSGNARDQESARLWGHCRSPLRCRRSNPIAAARIAFLCLIAACIILARRFAALGQQHWAAFSRATDVVFLLGFAGVASGSSSPAVVFGFWLALLLVWGWLAAVSIHLYRTVAAGSHPALA